MLKNPPNVTSELISQEEARLLAESVRQGASTKKALESIGLDGLPDSAVRSVSVFLRSIGQQASSVRVKPSLTVEQMEKATAVWHEVHRSTGSTKSAREAAHASVGGEGTISGTTFCRYFGRDGQTGYGRTMLETARRLSETGGAASDQP